MNAATNDFSAEYYHEADLRLARAVPKSARTVLDLHARCGHLGELLKHEQPGRMVTGLCRDAGDAQQARSTLDRVLDSDLVAAIPLLAAERFDCIVADGLGANFTDPVALLAALRGALAANGMLVASCRNAQHWPLLDALLAGDALEQRPLAFANIVRLLLDAGFLPHFLDRRLEPPPPEWLAAAAPLAQRLGLDPAAFATRVAVRDFFIAARPIAQLPDSLADCPPVTVGVCTNDTRVLAENLLASPCLAEGRHQILCVEGATSAAEGLNAVIEAADHELVVLAHQDVYLPQWWIARLWQQYAAARATFGETIGVLGAYGVANNATGIGRYGRVADREFLLDEPTPLPARVGSLDELVLVVPRLSPLRFDPILGFHLYGTDICLAAEQRGLVAAVIDAPCFHNSKQGAALPSAFHRSSSLLAAKWRDRLPIATPCALVH